MNAARKSPRHWRRSCRCRIEAGRLRKRGVSEAIHIGEEGALDENCVHDRL
jgi:hypothetical protein